MVARISSGCNPTGAVYYNENKVEKGEAERLAVRNYELSQLPVQSLTLGLIAGQLESQAELNERIKKPTFHASLSMAQGEKPSSAELLAIADRYMDGMGYARQPYVVYQHFDTDHTHVHIVSVRVDENGKKVPDNYEREKSNKLRQVIENEFGLQVAERAALKPERQELQPIEYGQGDLKRDLSAVVQSVLKEFTFSSFAQYNQLLSNYNVKATEVYIEGKKPGLVYSVMDNQKVTQGTPYKASSLPYQPTMEMVNRRINAGKKIKGDRIAGVRKVVSEQIGPSANWDNLQQRLSQLGIEIIPHFSKDKNLYGISYIDTRLRVIYVDSELGKTFTAGLLRERLGETYFPSSRWEVIQQNQTNTEESRSKKQNPKKEILNQTKQAEFQTPIHNFDLVRQLLYALGSDTTGDENERELKSMLKRARIPKRS